MDEDVHVRLGDVLVVGVEIVVDHLQPLVDVDGDVGEALHAVAIVAGQGVEVDVLALALQELPREEGDVLGGEVGVHVVDEDVDEGGQVRDVAEGEHLAGDGHEEVLLRAYAADVGGGVAGAEAHDLERLLAVEVLLTGGDAYIEVLGRVVVVHVHGHIVVHAADGVHELDKGVEVHDRVAVYLEAEDVLEAVHEPVDAVAAVVDARGVERVDLLDRPGDVDHRVARDADDVDLVRLGVHTADHHGVRVVADLVETDDEEGVHVLIERGGRAGVGVLGGLSAGRGADVAVGGDAGRRRVHQAAARPLGGLLPYHIRRHGAEDQHQNDANHYRSLGAPPGCPASLFPGGLPAAVFLSVHYISTPFVFFRCIDWSRTYFVPAERMITQKIHTVQRYFVNIWPRALTAWPHSALM